MSVKIRLTRVGTKKRPMYRIVVADSRAPRDGKNIEIIGSYNPMVKPAEVRVKEDRVQAWVAQGAEISPTVKGLLKRSRTAAAAAAK